MAGRIISLQRQTRELGRLRTGWTDTSGEKPRPVKSQTWVVTSHAEHYVRGAADAWGGTPEKWQPLGGGVVQWRVITETAALEALLPPGDPLSQCYEMWSKGGCARRCDGVTETLSNGPCICLAQHGDAFHEQPKGAVCAATSRLNVFLPDMPDVGMWRVETHSFYAAGEIAGAVDLIRSAVGTEAIIPIRLRIEQRQRRAEGRTKSFPVVVVELRGITTGQVLGASVMGGRELAARAHREAVGGDNTPSAAAITTGPTLTPSTPTPAGSRTLNARDEATLLQQIADVSSLAQLSGMSQGVAANFDVNPAGPIPLAFRARAEQLKAPPAPGGEQPVLDPDELWAKVMRSVPEDWTTTQLEQDFAVFAGIPAEQAGGADMAAYLEHLGKVAS